LRVKSLVRNYDKLLLVKKWNRPILHLHTFLVTILQYLVTKDGSRYTEINWFQSNERRMFGKSVHFSVSLLLSLGRCT